MAEFKRSDDIPYGGKKQLEEGFDVADAGLFSTDPIMSDVEDEYDAELLAPSDRPTRPLTHGMSFGPGADYVALPQETEVQFLSRIAANMMEVEVPEEAKVWAARRLAGG